MTITQIRQKADDLLENIRLTLDELLKLDYTRVRVYYEPADTEGKDEYYEVVFDTDLLQEDEKFRTFKFQIYRKYVKLDDVAIPYTSFSAPNMVIPCEIFAEYDVRLNEYCWYTLVARADHHLRIAQEHVGIDRQIKITKLTT